MLPTKMLKLPLAVAVPAVALLAGQAGAIETSLVLDPTSPGVNQADFMLSVNISPFGLLTSSGSSGASGTIVADIGFDGLLPDAVEFLPGTDIGFTDVMLIEDIFGVPTLIAETQNIRGTITSPVLTVSPTGEVDLGGSVLTLDEGFIFVQDENPTNNDLSGNPVILTLPTGSIASLTSTDLGGGNLGLVLSGPIDFTGEVDDDPLITLSVTGDILARGSVLVPEPATASLLAVGALVALRRRR
jgi:hypothetical protein